MLRGTRILEGVQARQYTELVNILRSVVQEAGFEEVIVPSIWEAGTFLDKVGDENRRMMWTFQDQGGRDVCLIPEVTGIIQEMWREHWSKTSMTRNIFYVQRCYRYERPQAGRYREFTQFGVELLGAEDGEQAKNLLRNCLDASGVDYEFTDGVRRGLSYYLAGGFEAAIPTLGAQRQVAGGGPYAEGVGWAIGVDRLLLAKQGGITS